MSNTEGHIKVGEKGHIRARECCPSGGVRGGADECGSVREGNGCSGSGCDGENIICRFRRFRWFFGRDGGGVIADRCGGEDGRARADR